jgi:5-methyltetrahydropteroyltriglutamate--homocysteine methyltransferase
MQRSTDRILVTHAGTLPRPADLLAMLVARDEGKPFDQTAFAARVREAVAETVARQVATGIDVVNDGEESKRQFSTYARERLSGFEERDLKPGEGPEPLMIFDRDAREFAEYFDGMRVRRQVFCVAPLRYVGHAAVQADIDNFRAALQGVPERAAQKAHNSGAQAARENVQIVTEAFLPAVALGSIEHWMRNEYYPTDEAYIYAIADAMHEEYKAIVDAGFILQIDDPDLADAWQIHPDFSLQQYLAHEELRIEALNHALRGLPPERVRLHMCWGSYHGPHKYDVPLREIVDLILRVNAGAYSIEASNPCHAHEWRVWEDVKLPEGKILIPGVVGHYCDFVEHPELVAERLVRYAKLVGRENVIAGTDCGIGTRVGHATVAWAKLEALAAGARLAGQQLWGR